MQYKALHKNVYRLYAYARTQECLDAHRQHHEERVRLWQAHKAEGLSDDACQRLSGLSRASYYRSKAALAALDRGGALPASVVAVERTLRDTRGGAMSPPVVIRRPSPWICPRSSPSPWSPGC